MMTTTFNRVYLHVHSNFLERGFNYLFVAYVAASGYCSLPNYRISMSGYLPLHLHVSTRIDNMSLCAAGHVPMGKGNVLANITYI